MSGRPQILLCPQFTELEWVIAPQLEQWADVATFDAPGVGSEPVPEEGLERIDREIVVERALEEIDRLGWDSYFVLGDAFGTPTAVRVAQARPDAVLGIALGHAALHLGMEGDRAPVNGELCAAMTQLLRSDYDAFKHGLTQFTQGGFDEDRAAAMVQRFPDDVDVAVRAWQMNLSESNSVAEILAALGVPLLLAKHEGCLVFSPEGYEDAVAAFPSARTIAVEKTCGASPEFAQAVREFCEEVLAAA
jgi:pimeloyl-ACP methyl ester carboxylesterase